MSALTLNVTTAPYRAAMGPVLPLETSLPGTGQRFAIAAGGYRGVNNPSVPTWGIAFHGVSTTPINNGQFSVYDLVGMIDGATGTVVEDNQLDVDSNPASQYFENLRMPLVAYDYDGDSLRLGAPVHYTVDNAVNTDFVLQEPPKHAYYDNNPTSQTYGQVVTVSRYDPFNVTLQDSNNTTFSSQSTDSYSSAVGKSTGGSASATVSAGADLGIFDVEASVTAKYEQTADYTDEQNKQNTNSQYGSRSVSVIGQSNRDDYLSGRMQIIDIWRYRIFGLAIPGNGATPPNGFYDIVLPGPVETFAGGGQSFDWYQPLHENGNILSYPSELGNNNLPADLGVYTDTTGAVLQQPLVPASVQAFDGTSGSVALQYGSTSGAGYIKGYSDTYTDNSDVEGKQHAGLYVFAGILYYRRWHG